MTFPTNTWLFDRIEVLRGPASVLYGEGAINYIPRQPLRTGRVTDVLLSGGSYDTYRVGLNTTGPLADRLAYQFGVIGTSSGGHVDNGDWQRLSLASSLLFDVTPDLTLTLAFDGSLNEPSRYWGTPLRGDSIDEAFRKRNYNVLDSVIRYEDYWVRLRADWRATPSLTVRNETYALITDRSAPARSSATPRGASASGTGAAPPTIGGLDAVATAARRLLPDARPVRVDVLDAYDFYWYAHHEPRPLPVVRVVFDDPHATWFHIDPVTGDVLERLDASRRAQRILFNALHSLDFPILLAHRPAWDVVVVALSALGMALSVTAVVVAWRWVRR